MPATSAKQKRFMNAAAHNPAFAKKVGVPINVAKEYSEKSKGKKFKRGGDMKTEMKKVAKAEVKGHEARMHKGKKKMAMGGMAVAPAMDPRMAGRPGYAKGGCAPSKMAKGGGIETKGKTKGKMVKMATGGSVSKRADGVAKKGKTSCKMS